VTSGQGMLTPPKHLISTLIYPGGQCSSYTLICNFSTGFMRIVTIILTILPTGYVDDRNEMF
jgi:hypothetical protein